MNRWEAFKEWMQAANNHSYTNFDIWEAACDYQRESDEQVCREEQVSDWLEYNDACIDCANAIRNNK